MERKSYSFDNYGRGGEGRIDPDSEEAKMNRKKLIDGSEEYQTGKAALEFMEGIKGKKEEKMSYKALYKLFSDDVEIIRGLLAKYHKAADKMNKDLRGEEILDQSEKIKSEIEFQIAATNDPYEKGEFANLIVDLDKITKGVEGLPDLKEVNG